MAYNLLVTYDLDKPGQNYDAVHAKIKSLGRWFHPQFSVFYLHSALTADEAHRAIWSVMDRNDKLIVANISRIVIEPALDEEIAAINALWNAAA